MADYLALYVFVRTDMQSMTNGKMAAHSGHAANHFTYNHFLKPGNLKHRDDVEVWMKQANGFGTQINLKAPWSDVMDAVVNCEENGFATGVVVDPTYPYIVNSEIKDLIYPETHTLVPVAMADGNYMCFRREATAAYVFGYKEALQPYIGKFPLHP